MAEPTRADLVKLQLDEINNCSTKSAEHLSVAENLLLNLDRASGITPSDLTHLRLRAHIDLGRACNERAMMLVQSLQGVGIPQAPLAPSRPSADSG